MNRFITTAPSNKRVFDACLFTFATLIASIASLGIVAAFESAGATLRAGRVGSLHRITHTYNGDARFNASSPSGALSPAVLPAVNLTVNTLGDEADVTLDGNCDTDTGTAGSQCTLRAAIQETNNIPGDDTIGFALAPNSTITLDNALDQIDGNLTINGPAANLLTVERSFASGTPNFRIFFIRQGRTVNISGLTIANGNVMEAGGGVLNDGNLTLTDCNLYGNTGFSGGAVINAITSISPLPSLTINNCNIGGTFPGQSNTANEGGGVYNNFGLLTISGGSIKGNSGGGIFMDAGFVTLNSVSITDNITSGSGGGVTAELATISITNSVIANNTATTGGGIIAANGVQVTIVNTTISGNSSTGSGGGIASLAGPMTLTNVTVTNNRSDSDDSGGEAGGGLHAVFPNTILKNTIVAGNFRGTSPSIADDINGPVDPASSFNLIGTGGSGGLTDGVNENQVGVADALLGPLGNNGGPTQTHHLLSGSPAIDKGKNFETDEDNIRDQRGLPRPVDLAAYPNATGGDASDIGAYELQGDTVQGGEGSLIVNTPDDHDDGACTDGDCTLREAIISANLNADTSTITFDLPGAGPHIIQLTEELDFLETNMNIEGPTDESVEVRGESIFNPYSIFTIFSDIELEPVVSISNLTISEGAELSFGGGGILNFGTLTVNNTTFTHNFAEFGGAIDNEGVLNIRNSTFIENLAVVGGAVYSFGDLNIENSTFTLNQSFEEGGAVDTEAGTLTIVNSTISGNSSYGDGGGLLHCGDTTGVLINVTITNNTADADGDGFGAGGGIGQVSSQTIKLSNTIVAGNFAGLSPDTTPDDIFVDTDFGSAIDTANSFNNLIGDANTSGGITHGNLGNIVGNGGTGTIDINTVLDTTLASNGGPTQTHALVPGGPAIDNGNDSEATAAGLTTDQRGPGFSRFIDGNGDATATVDIGAFEAGTDTTPPMVVSIDDGDADNVVFVNTTLTYTITFNEDIDFDGDTDEPQVSAADFDNAGTATITIGTISETSPGVFTVQVTPTTTGTIILRIPAGATITDTDGNALATPVSDDDTVMVIVPPVLSPANVSGTKTKSGGTTPTSTVTYTVVLSNSSSFAQLDNPGNEFTDVLPSSLTLVSASPTSGTATVNTGTNTVSWNGSIAGNGSVTITITATIENVPAGTIISNQGTISYDADGDGTNEASRLTDDPSVGGASDPTSFSVSDSPIPPFTGTNQNLAGSLAISEFRADGPNGASDEYVEVCNISTRTFTILADDPGRIRGIGVYSFIQASSTPVFLFSIPDGTVFEPGQCFLGAGQTFSLAAPGGIGFVPGLPFEFGNSPYDGASVDALFDPDRSGTVSGADADAFQSDTGVAIFGTDNARFGFNTQNQPVALKSGTTIPTALVDAVGFDNTPVIQFPGAESPIAQLFREGTGLKPIGIQDVQYAFVRRYCAATSAPCVVRPNNDTTDQQMRDVNDNATDFYGSRPVVPTSTQAEPVMFTVGSLVTTAMLGAPGPEGYTGEIVSPEEATDTQPVGFVFGAPARKRFNSAIAALNISTVSFDTSQGNAFNTPNRERVFAVPRGLAINEAGQITVPEDNNEASAPKGTFAFRFTIRNQTGQTISRLRFRLVDATTDNRGVVPDAFTGSAIPASQANQAILRLISSTTARVFVNSGADQNCTHTVPTPAGQTPCGGPGFKLVQGLVLDSTQPQGTSAGNVGSGDTIPPGAPLGNGVNAGLNVEDNSACFCGGEPFPSNEGGGDTSSNPDASTRTSGIVRGTGTFFLAVPLAPGDAMSIEFRFGVQQNGRFYLQIIPEADNFGIR